MVSFRPCADETEEFLFCVLIKLILPILQFSVNNCKHCSEDLLKNNRFNAAHIRSGWRRVCTRLLLKTVNEEIEDTEMDRFFMVGEMLTYDYIFGIDSFLEMCTVQIILSKFKKNIRYCDYYYVSSDVNAKHLTDAIESMNAMRLTDKIAKLTELNAHFHFLRIEAWWESQAVKDNIYHVIMFFNEEKDGIIVTNDK